MGSHIADCSREKGGWIVERNKKKKKERELGKHTEESSGILDVGFLCLLRGAVVADVEEFGPMGVDKMISEMKTIGWTAWTSLALGRWVSLFVVAGGCG